MGQAYPRKGLCGEGSVAPRGAPTAAGCPSHGWFATLFVGTAPEAERACSGGGVEALSTPYARGGVQYNMQRGLVLTENTSQHMGSGIPGRHVRPGHHAPPAWVVTIHGAG